jgi:phosphonopyruvate decarboxylase
VTSAAEFVAALDDGAVELVSGVPCSYFAGPIRLLPEHPRIRYVPAANEGGALAVAAGAALAGARSAAILQNSGFGNLVNPLTSLVLPYRIPMLVFVSMRGWPVADAGEPQHHWMGQVVAPWLDSLHVMHRTLVNGGPPLREVLAELAPALDRGEPGFILVGKGAITDVSAPGAEPQASDDRPSRDDLVDAVLCEVDSEYVLSTTGYLSRALFNRGDRPRNFYMQGSMGHVPSLALGAALARPGERFLVLDGDGAALMHLGGLATVGHLAPPNLVHVVFDNQAYDSTGGQPTTSSTVDFAAVARGVGYRTVVRTTSKMDLRKAVRDVLDAAGPAMLIVDGVTGGATGERASNQLTPPTMTRRFSTGLTAAAKATA